MRQPPPTLPLNEGEESLHIQVLHGTRAGGLHFSERGLNPALRQTMVGYGTVFDYHFQYE